MPTLLLASSSPYRRELLARLQLPFSWQSPSIDESQRAGEDALALVKRLAEEKARAELQGNAGSRLRGADDSLGELQVDLVATHQYACAGIDVKAEAS